MVKNLSGAVDRLDLLVEGGLLVEDTALVRARCRCSPRRG